MKPYSQNKKEEKIPIIGIVVCGLEEHRQFVTDAYIQAILHAGGQPIIIPFVKSAASIRQYVSLCSGFLLCGGGDISPLLFGEQPNTSVGTIDMTFDIFQIKLVRHIIKLRKPILGICRGMQIINVALCGTIYQDLSHAPNTASFASHTTIHHMQINQNRQDVSHSIKIKRRTKLSRILGTTLYINSYHHQAIHKLGKGLLISAKSQDGVIEAMEHKNYPFLIGVQWHPECMLSGSNNMKKLFLSFVKESR